MKLMLKIAWRNIFRHRGKSLVIGIILFLGALLMTVGNGVITGMDHGISKNIVNAFMGDIVLISEKQKSDNVFFDFMGTSVESIGTYKVINETLKELDFVHSYLPVGKNLAMLLSEDQSTPGFVYLLGVDIEAYQKMFPGNFKLLEGRVLNPGEKGLIVPTFAREELYSYSSQWMLPEGGELIKENMKKELVANFENVAVSSSIVLMGMSSGMNSTTDVRFGIKGIVKYDALNTILGHFCIADIESYRECMGYFSAAENSVEVPREEKRLLNMETSDMDALFAADSMIVESTRKYGAAGGTAIKAKSAVEVPEQEDGIYNLVFVKLKDGISYSDAIKLLNRELSANNAGVKAVTWNSASGPIGSMAIIIKSALFVFVTLLFIVAIIIIINTLTMAALERTPEIGMMRAVGARKSFISGMFFGETGLLAFAFGGAGIVAGVIAVKIVPLFKITTDNDMLQLLYGGDVFYPILTLPDIALTVLQLSLVTVIAALYPVAVAKNITPLDAIQRD